MEDRVKRGSPSARKNSSYTNSCTPRNNSNSRSCTPRKLDNPDNSPSSWQHSSGTAS